MKYFFDTEFIEGFHAPLFGKRRHFIDLISIGIYCEDGRHYYAISTEFNAKDADDWVKQNVISKLPEQHVSIYDSPRIREDSLLWKSNRRIKNDIMEFFQPSYIDGVPKFDYPEIYAYYADYDWVVFCSLFGRMIDLPNGFPMYCRDLKQSLDEYATGIGGFKALKNNDKLFPQNEREHDALEDAKWNFKLFKYLENAEK